MIDMIISSFWFFLPAGIANMAPVFVKNFQFLNRPVDNGAIWRGKPLFGANKTWKGFFFGIIAAMVVVLMQKKVYAFMQPYSLIDYGPVSALWLGLALGGGALIGDLVKSFFKRQMNIPPGKSWIPFDQIDWIVGALIFSLFFIDLNLRFVVVTLALFGVLHAFINLVGYALKIRPNLLLI